MTRTFTCITHVLLYVSTETGDGTTKIDVRVPTQLLDRIDELYGQRGYTSRSDAIRDAMWDWINPPSPLSEETLEDLAVSREQRERGETRPLEDVAADFDIDLDDHRR